jgi:hypothetical protein
MTVAWSFLCCSTAGRSAVRGHLANQHPLTPHGISLFSNGQTQRCRAASDDSYKKFSRNAMEQAVINPHDWASFYRYETHSLLAEKFALSLHAASAIKLLILLLIYLIFGGIMVGDVLIGLLIVALFFAMPAWPYSSKWGYYPIGIIGSALVVMLILSLIGLI